MAMFEILNNEIRVHRRIANGYRDFQNLISTRIILTNSLYLNERPIT